MSRQPLYSHNQRVEFMDGERIHHVGFVKASHRIGLFRKEIWYDIAELTKEKEKRVFFVKEEWIFGQIENKKEKPLFKEDVNAVMKDISELKNYLK